MLTAVHFINDETGFIGSEEKGCCFGDELNLGAVFLKTYNGGNTWTKKYFPDINEFYEIIFFDELTGLALCSVKENDNSIRKILKTEDGGQNWNPVAIQGIKSIATYKLNARPDLFPVVAIDKDDQEVLLISIDNGISWQIKDLPAQECNRIYFFNENVGFASCGLLFFPEYVYETVDGGTNWKFVPGNPFNFSSVVHFYSEKEGLIINGHYHYEVSHGEGWDILDYYDVYETEDGGQEWSITSVLRDCDFEGNYFMRDKNHFCLLGTDFIKFEIK
jgi:photosystem II stability/assembly factor-like uncharacterized protein